MTAKEKRREYMKQYYQSHKDLIKAKNKKWREENKEKFYKSVYAYRKRKALELKKAGVKFNWLTKNERERKNAERDSTTN